MEHNSILFNMLLGLVFGPLILALIVGLRRSSKAEQEIEQSPESRWRMPEPLLVNLPFDIACKTVAEELPNFSFLNGAWQIVNIEEGIPTTIAANLPGIDERDPDNVQRFDIGLLTTVSEQPPPGSFSIVKMNFIPYEGPDSTLERISLDTYKFLEQALRRNIAAINSGAGVQGSRQPGAMARGDSRPDAWGTSESGMQPPAVPAELDFSASSGAPTEAVSDFLVQSNEKAKPVSTHLEPSRRAADFAQTPVFDQVPTFDQAAVFNQVPTFDQAAVFDQAEVSQLAPVPTPMPVHTPKPVSMPEPGFTPEPVAMPDLGPLPDLFNVPFVPPAPFEIPAAHSIAAPLATTNPAAGNETAAGICPGCSQPINPSFPFCLYCGKNF
jgi:hypothetical protein